MIIKNLAVFDFDYTILDDNSDTAVMNLVDKSKITKDVRKLYKSNSWTAYMQAIFRVLHGNGVTETDICSYIQKLPQVKGMSDLISELNANMDYDLVIISDSNSYFIRVWLEYHKLDTKIVKVFTNPAYFDSNGLLNINMYHVQDTCNLSTKNLCKGMVMEDFIKAQAVNNVKYDKIIYIGDGHNDFCPILRLTQSDIACVRENYNCVDMVKKAKTASGYLDEDKIQHFVKADVCVWNTGEDIMKYILNT